MIARITNLYLKLTLDCYKYMPVAYVTVHYMIFTLIKLRYARFMSTKGFLIRYSKGHAQYTYRQLKNFYDNF